MSPASAASRPASVALCDFDWKDPKRKGEHWRRKEAELINGGYYTAGKISCGGETFTPPTLCLLEHKAGKGANTSEVIVATKEAEQRSGQYLPQQTRAGKTYMHQTDVDVLLERLRRNERGQEASVTDPRSLKDPTR
jgi:inositol-pentakisphosphate 2-kinase